MHGRYKYYAIIFKETSRAKTKYMQKISRNPSKIDWKNYNPTFHTKMGETLLRDTRLQDLKCRATIEKTFRGSGERIGIHSRERRI